MIFEYPNLNRRLKKTLLLLCIYMYNLIFLFSICNFHVSNLNYNLKHYNFKRITKVNLKNPELFSSKDADLTCVYLKFFYCSSYEKIFQTNYALKHINFLKLNQSCVLFGAQSLSGRIDRRTGRGKHLEFTLHYKMML